MISSTIPIFDAHLDLAYLAELGRDMTLPLDSAAGPHPPATVTLPELQKTGVLACLGTIFLEATDSPAPGDEPVCYPPGDANEAYFKGINQLNLYHLWRQQGLIQFFNDPDLPSDPAEPGAQATRATLPPSPPGGEGRGEGPSETPAPSPSRGQGWGEGSSEISQMPPHPSASQTPSPQEGEGGTPINLGILIECADPIIEPHHLSFWAGRGVVAISLSWAVESRYAGGNSTSVGLTKLGHELINEMGRLKIALDLSHLSQRATYDALDHTEVRICATHSNCRSLLGEQNNPAWQRHLDDDTIKTIASRKGIIGLNLFKQFIQWPISENHRPEIAKAIDHIDHICQLTGSAKHIGIGSDLDGGFGANDLPIGINRAADMRLLFDELSKRNYSDTEIRNFAHDNWAGFFGLV